MATSDSLETLQGLHRDLLALSENRLRSVERLVAELESRVDEFRELLNKKTRNDASRQKLTQGAQILSVASGPPPLTCTLGTIEIDGVKYTVNDDFKQDTIEISDELDLDEIDAAKLFLLAQDDAQELDRSPVVTAVIRFHQRRQLLLECFRLILKIANAPVLEETEIEDVKTFLRTIMDNITDARLDDDKNGCHFWQKCLNSMADIEAWLQRLTDRSQRASVIGHSFSEDAVQIIEYERVALTRQHESLASMSTIIMTTNRTYEKDVAKVLTRAKLLDRHDIILVHYLPILMATIARTGSASFGSDNDANEWSKLIHAEKEVDHWALRNLHSTMLICWYAECTNKEINIDQASGKNEAKTADQRFERFTKALQDGAFHLMLSVAQDVKKSEWPDPAKTAIIDFLLEDAVRLPADSLLPESDFQDLLMDQYQAFADALITNLPDTLRRLRLEEDEQRRILRSRFQRAPAEYQSHLERFLVIISFAYDDDVEAADGFWSDPDGNLYGFLQWLAKRQTTPRAAAFCELLRSISQNETCANATHAFLLEEGVPVPGKFRRTGSISWNQIFAELDFYASSIKDRPALVQSGSFAQAQAAADSAIEPESALMLECYLRLVSHLCLNSMEARAYLLKSENPRFDVLLLLLAGSNIESRLRACAFTTLASLLTGKTLETGEGMWVLLDYWMSGGVAPSNVAARSPGYPTPAWSEQTIFGIIMAGYEEPNAFLRLLNALVTPYSNEAGLNDALPFPENLGSSYRMPGISSYVDFAVGRIFGEKSLTLTKQTDQRIMRLNCLDFIATCLSTFNDDLVVLANRSSFPVEGSMRSSSLEAYVRLHPFARTMEWMYNEKVLNALFTTTHQDIDEVNTASSDSPFVLSLIRSIDVMNLILKLQPTYLDIVRPLIKQSTTRREPVAHAAIASFEEAVMTNLNIIVDLGLYCGTGHQDLIITSLALLEKLAGSRKLIVPPMASFSKRGERSKMIGVLEQDNEADRIAKSLIVVLRQDERELEAGPESSGYIIKNHILSFLLRCLEALPDRPTIAHLLMGFNCGANDIGVSLDGLFAQGASLFHAIVRLSLDYPNGDGETFSSWLSAVRIATINILQLLWRSPLSSGLIMTELRTQEYIFLQAVRKPVLSSDTLWDGKIVSDPEFLVSDGALALRNVLSQRVAFLDLFSREIRVASREAFSTLLSRLSSTLLGSTKFPGLDPIPSPTIFDFFDFMEIDLGEGPGDPKFNLLQNLDFSICRDDPDSLFNLGSANELILLRRNELQKAGRALAGSPELTEFETEAETAIALLRAANQRRLVEASFADTLRAWVQLVTIALEIGDFEAPVKAAFALQTMQLILPKLEQALSDNLETAVQLSQLLSSLLRHSGNEGDATADGSGTGIDTGLFHAFRISLNGIVCNIATPELREICSLNCYRYLQKFVDSSSNNKDSSRSRKVLRTLKLAGSRFMDTICDDAYSLDQSSSCRVAALLLLEALVKLAAGEKSDYLLESFARTNFVGVLVDGIKNIPQELGQVGAAGRSYKLVRGSKGKSAYAIYGTDLEQLIRYYQALLTLLLRIAMTRLGSTQILRANLFQAISESHIFAADPDIGFEIESPESLKRYFELMAQVLRIVIAVVLARGSGHEGTVEMARRFLEECRSTVVGIFKRAKGIGGRVEKGEEAELEDLVDGFTVLITVTGFLDVSVPYLGAVTATNGFKYEDGRSPRKIRLDAFT